MRTVSIGILYSLLSFSNCYDENFIGTNTTGTNGESTAAFESSGSDNNLNEIIYDEIQQADFAFASNIELRKLTINQGVEGIWGESSAPSIISGRPALVRAFWRLQDDFEPRMLRGRLILQDAMGHRYTQEVEQWVRADSQENDLSQTFSWLIPADFMQPGLRLRVQALDPSPELRGSLPDGPPSSWPSLPKDPEAMVEIYDRPLQIYITIVPILHQFNDCESGPDPSDDELLRLKQALEQQMPTQEVVLTLHDKVIYKETIGNQDNGFWPILTMLAELRQTEMAPGYMLYYGLLNSCDGLPPDAGGGTAASSGATKKDAFWRNAVGFYDPEEAWTIDHLFVHEIGHLLGRPHVECTGEEDDPDVNYPIQGGKIDALGFGIHDHQLRLPEDSHDYMGYCSNAWVSSYGWEKTLEIIELMTSWTSEQDDLSDSSGVLVGIFYADGNHDWWTARGQVTADEVQQGYRAVFSNDDRSVEMPVAYQDLHDRGTYTLTIPLPKGFEEFEQIELDQPQKSRISIQQERIRRLYSRTLK